MACGRPNAIWGRIMPRCELIRCRLRSSRYNGVMATVMGNIMPAANSEYSSLLNLNSYRAMTKLTIKASTTMPTIVPMETIRELTSSGQKMFEVNTVL